MKCHRGQYSWPTGYPLLPPAQLSPRPQLVAHGAATPQIGLETAFWSPDLGAGGEDGNSAEKLSRSPRSNLPLMGYHLELKILWNARPGKVMIRAASPL